MQYGFDSFDWHRFSGLRCVAIRKDLPKETSTRPVGSYEVLRSFSNYEASPLVPVHLQWYHLSVIELDHHHELLHRRCFRHDGQFGRGFRPGLNQRKCRLDEGYARSYVG